MTATATVTVSTGGSNNLNHIIYMLQENRAFDNYFGVFAKYRVNIEPPIQGAQLSDVNDLHTLPPGYTSAIRREAVSDRFTRAPSASRTCRPRGTKPTTTWTWWATTG